ncbi:hypothetical protein C8R47DRAFT_575379 [Mycena vitilis]|nr:hypothetical protein C8R47DRAFT_575379 [Mycena vitilis]
MIQLLSTNASGQNDQIKDYFASQAANGRQAKPMPVYEAPHLRPGSPYMTPARFGNQATPYHQPFDAYLQPSDGAQAAPMYPASNLHSQHFPGQHPLGAVSRKSSWAQSQPVSRQSSLASLKLRRFEQIDPLSSQLLHPSSPAAQLKDVFMPPTDSPLLGHRSYSTQTQVSERGVQQSSNTTLSAMIATLKEEMAENLDAGLDRNMRTFSRKLQAQQAQLKSLEHNIIRQVLKVQKTLRDGPHDRVQNSHIKALWKEMGWKLSVPDREFVLNLHDYLMDQYSQPTEFEEYFDNPPPDDATIERERDTLRKALLSARSRTQDKWALDLLTPRNIPKILEAFDGDGSGFVSVWEVNGLTSACPKDWNLLQWLAYWIVGSHLTVWQYRSKICAILQRMHHFAEGFTPEPRGMNSILTANRFIVDEYLDGVWHLDQILASIQPCTESLDPHLADLADEYVSTEEKRLERILESLNYEIDGPDTLALIIGRHQIERNLFPVLYLLLKRHLEIIYEARNVFFSRDELLPCITSVRLILDSVFLRIQNLETSYIQQPGNIWNSPADKFLRFAFGMYHRIRYTPELQIVDVLRLSVLSDDEIEVEHPTSVGGNTGFVLKFEVPPQPVLSSPPRKPILSSPTEMTRDSIQTNSESGVCGPWTGYFNFSYDNRIRVDAIIELSLHVDCGALSGGGSYCAGRLEVTGSQEHSGKLTLALIGIPDDPTTNQGFRISFSGQMVDDHASRQSCISGRWKDSNLGESGELCLHRLPTWLHRFKYKLAQATARTPHALWMFVLAAVRQQVRVPNSRFLPRPDLRDLRLGVDLTRRQYVLGSLDRDETEEYENLLLRSTPWEARVFRCLAKTTTTDLTLHMNASCSDCGRAVIREIRHRCLDCLADFCSECVDRPPAHQSQLHSHLHVLRLRRYVPPRRLVILLHKAVTGILCPPPQIQVRSPTVSFSAAMRKAELPSLRGTNEPETNTAFTAFKLASLPQYGDEPEKEGGGEELPDLDGQKTPTWDNASAHHSHWEPAAGHLPPPPSSNGVGDKAPTLHRSQTRRSSVPTSEGEEDVEGDATEESLDLCICCRGMTYPRYWVCIPCSERQPNTEHVRICVACEAKPRWQFVGVKGRFGETHDKFHPLVRVDKITPFVMVKTFPVFADPASSN